MGAPLFLQGGSLVIPTGSEPDASPQGFAQDLQMLRYSLLLWSQLVGQIINANLSVNSSSAGRPTSAQLAPLPSAGIGYSVFDTDLGAPIWWNGAAWIDASGSPV